MTEVAVIGGGLAGLVAAGTLADRGVETTLFERREELGGRVRSRTREGFTLDRGFQVLFTAYPAVRRELDLDALDLGRFTPGATLARPGERSVLADPIRNPRALSASLFNREVTFRDKLRVLALRRALSAQPAEEALSHDGESIESYLDRRGFSEQFRSNFAGPFYGGITLDRSLSTSRAVFEYTFKMLSEGAIALPAAGMGAIATQLAERARAAGARLRTESAVSGLTAGEGVELETPGETVEADAAVVATDPRSARELTGVESIPTGARGCVTQQFSLPGTQQLGVGSRLLLNAADDRPNQVAPVSAAAPAYAPDGEQLLSATFLGEQEESDEALAAEVRSALASWFPENQFGDLELLATDRIEFAQFDQPPGFRSGLPAVDAPEGPVYLAGEYTRWSSIQGALESGRTAAVTAGQAV